MMESEHHGNTMDVYEAMQTLGAFDNEHGPHGAKLDIDPDSGTITLFCDAHTPPVYEILQIDRVELRRAAGRELSGNRALTF